MSKIKRVSKKQLKDTASRVEHLKAKMDDSPYHQIKASGKSVTRMGYEWIYVVQYLKKLNKDDGFDKIMESDLLLQIEKDFILFNLHRLKEIASWPHWKFNNSVGQFAIEAAGYEFEDEESEDE